MVLMPPPTAGPPTAATSEWLLQIQYIMWYIYIYIYTSGSDNECTDELIPAIVVPVVLFIALVIMIISVLLYCLKRQCQTYNITSE